MLKRLAIVFLVGIVAGVVYGKVATVYHLWVPPDWLGRLLSADGETALDLLYVGLWIDGGVLALVLYIIFRAVIRLEKS